MYESKKIIIKQIYRLIKKNEVEILEVLFKEFSRNVIESKISEIVVINEEIKSVLKNLKKWSKLKRVPTPFQLQPGKSYIKREPYGTVLIISPWNFPFHLSLVPAIGALAAGNKVIIKTSPLAPNSSRLLHKMFNEELQSDLIRVEEGGKEKVLAILEEKIDFIFFTGSEKNGREIYQLAAERMIPIIMELSGQNPLIFHSDGYLKALNRIVWGKLLNAGQTCLSPNHLFVHHTKKEALIQSFRDVLNEFYGEQILENTDYPKIINTGEFERLVEIIHENRESLILGGKSNIDSLKIEPTLIDVKIESAKDSSLLNTEIFGPILPIISYDNINEVIQLINENSAPLSIYIFSSDKELINQVANQTISGSICVNDCLVQGSNPHFPFGGVQNSGIGKYHGIHSFNAFSNPKSILIRSKKFSLIPRFPPFSKKIFKIYDHM